MDYYKLEKILEEEEKIKVKFPCEIENFGMFINPSLANIKKEVKVDLSLYLIKFLIQNEFCSVLENPFQKLKNDLEADSSIVDLKNKYFYGVCKNLINKKILSGIFYERVGSFIGLMLKKDFTEDDVMKMSAEEKKILMSSRQEFKRFQDFYNNLENN